MAVLSRSSSHVVQRVAKVCCFRVLSHSSLPNIVKGAASTSSFGSKPKKETYAADICWVQQMSEKCANFFNVVLFFVSIKGRKWTKVNEACALFSSRLFLFFYKYTRTKKKLTHSDEAWWWNVPQVSSCICKNMSLSSSANVLMSIFWKDVKIVASNANHNIYRQMGVALSTASLPSFSNVHARRLLKDFYWPKARRKDVQKSLIRYFGVQHHHQGRDLEKSSLVPCWWCCTPKYRIRLFCTSFRLAFGQ